jgi:hypothetical protein
MPWWTGPPEFTTCWRCQHWTGGCTGACRAPGPHQVGRDEGPPPKGCICPPGSEKTCERWDCGRKNPNVKITAGSTP